MQASEILKAWLQYTDYDPNRTAFYLGSLQSSYHTCNKTISSFMPFNPSGEFAVLYAKKQFQKILSDNRINAFEAISHPELLKPHTDMWKLFTSEDITAIEKTVLDELDSLLAQVIPAKLIGTRDRESEYTALMGAIGSVVEALHKCHVELYLKGGAIGRISHFSTHIHVFNQLAECLLALENSPDGMYLCYLKEYDSADGYFGFFIKSNGTILSVNERLNESYPGEHKKHRNNRYTDDKQYDLFPYNFIFSYDIGGYDYKGYAKSHVIDEEQLAFFQLKPDAYLPLVIAMILLRNRYENFTPDHIPLMYVDSLLPVNLHTPLPGSMALTVPANSLIARNNHSLQIDFTTEDITSGKYRDLFPQLPRIYNDEREPNLNYRENEENVFIHRYGEGFTIDPERLLERNREVKRLSGSDSAESLTPNSEFVATAEQMQKIAYMNGRKQLTEYIRDKMFQEYLKVGGKPGIQKWWEQALPTAKKKVLDLCLTRYRQGKDNTFPVGAQHYDITMDLDARKRPYHGRIDPLPFNSWPTFKKSGRADLSHPLCCITGQRASHYFFFRIDTYEQLCDLVGTENVPDILIGYKRRGHRVFGNDALEATDPMTGLGTPFEEEEYRCNRRLWSSDTWSNYYLHNPGSRQGDKPFWEYVPDDAFAYNSIVDFGFAIGLSKRGLAQLLKEE